MYQVDSWNTEQKKYVIVIETNSYHTAFDTFTSLCKKEQKSKESQAIRLLIKYPKEIIHWWTNKPNEFN